MVNIMNDYFNRVGVCFLISIFFLGCASKNKSDKNEKKVIELSISNNGDIYVNDTIIDYCSLHKYLEYKLKDDSFNNSYLNVFPKRDIDMHTVDCILNEVKRNDLDSIRLGSRTNKKFIVIKLEEKKKYDSIYEIRILDDYNVLLNNDSLSFKELETSLNKKSSGNRNIKLILKVEKGVSYEKYEECKGIIDEINVRRDTLESKLIDVIEDSCPYCD